MFSALDDIVFVLTKGDVFVVFFSFLLIINIITIFVTYADKKFAIKDKRRVSEKNLLLLGLLGGALSEYILMNFIHHKTLHKKFMIGLPIIFVSQIALFVWWFLAWI